MSPILTRYAAIHKDIGLGGCLQLRPQQVASLFQGSRQGRWWLGLTSSIHHVMLGTFL
jgi:hypothetical protein